MTYVFSRKQDELLIDLVRVHPILYNPQHNHFKSLVKKHKKWETISSTLEIPLPDVKKRWRHIKDHYMRKLKRLEAGLLPHESRTWPLTKRLEFLKVIRAMRPDSEGEEVEFVALPQENDEGSNQSVADDDAQYLNSEDDYMVDDEAMLADNSPEITLEPARNTRKYSLNETSVVPVKEEVETTLEPVTEHRLIYEDERSATHKFFDSMADIVNRFPPRLAAETRLKVCQLVTEMELQLHSEQPNGTDDQR